ncbi:MAG TPA: DNA polymerase/3'-5' exonuclease PolX, partial [Polyangiaceae bacterium]|nr:DNA polymerase/3'-5' exonuclease PolX [Polyangiaceae bacterium]
VRTVLAHGPTKTLVRLTNGMDADLRVLASESAGAGLLYFTGSKSHNIALRKRALQLGLELSEYGLFRDGRLLASRTEEEIYAALGLAWIPPELREDGNEVEFAARAELPLLITSRDIQGDLHVHTSWSDGSASIEAMARAARERGRKYLAITDHTSDLAVAHALSPDRLRAQIAEVRRVESELSQIRLFAGVELNIRPDGSLDVDGAMLRELDWVGAAVHSHFDQPRDEATARLVRAIESGHIDVLFHPTSRSLGHRPGLNLDFDAVLAACLRSGTALEIDAQPGRLDLPDALALRAKQAGVALIIDSDAHSPAELGYLDTFGVSVARRAWVDPSAVLNTLSASELSARIEARRRTGRRRKAAPASGDTTPGAHS